MGIFMTVLKGIGITIVVLVGLGLSYQYIATKLDQQKYPAVGKMVDIGGYKLHMIDSGKNYKGPVIVMDGGAGCNALDWALVQPEIAKFARVITYDRAGYGWSDASPLERTSENIVEELRTMLKNAGIQGPYILVGHSFGGFNMQLFAAKYPGEVAGLILVDSSSEDAFEKYQKDFVPNTSSMWTYLALTYIGISRLMQYLSSVKAMNDLYLAKYPLCIKNILKAQRLSTKFVVANVYEGLSLEKNCQQLQQVGKSFGDMPLTVIRAGKPMIEKPITGVISQELMDKINKVWLEIQADLLKKSSRGKQLIAENSGHLIPYDQPEIIVEAVQGIYDELNQEK
ncbi:alpha/beta hydrolase [Candidatus Babeliales bacterium]|nr:alpha/beta hydrolase [Candidatus Babeliales bacterium]MBP9844403.1 alpha/beta hydrolase [Candidatus Babeliales bacterium]